MPFDFEKGGEAYGMYFRPLKPVAAATVTNAPTLGNFYHYEPGDGTRYEVIFSTYNTGYGLQTVMTLVNFNSSMVIPGRMDLVDIDYMHEKLKLTHGSCYALMPLINYYLNEIGR
jgi:hypothetical protein